MIKQTKVDWPEGKRFAFSVFDDTDGACIQNVGPLYNFLKEIGVLTTKSVWCTPPRGSFTGSSLADQEYAQWILALDKAGFEVALHNVGDGDFSREEILSGIEEFVELLGHPPRSHTNHVSNPDNLYWWHERFEWPISLLYRVFFSLLKRRKPPNQHSGSDPKGPRFWGDRAKELDLYVRNLVFNDINTLKRDPLMPWFDPAKPYVNWWFSSSDGHNCRIFNDLIAPERIDRLEEEGGACIVYTHFASGFVDEKGRIDPVFRQRMEYLATKRTGWFVPVSPLLDHLRAQKSVSEVNWSYRMSRNLIWGVERLAKRKRYGM